MKNKYFSSMKKYLILCLLMLPLLLYSFVLPGNKEKSEFKGILSDTSYNLLVAYGKYIYQREKCARCHTDTPGLDSTKISLENIAGKYPDSWHFYHLDDPRIVSPGSKMPRYNRLSKSPMTYKDILNLLRDEYTTLTEADSLEISQTLKREALPIIERLKKDFILPDKPEYNQTIALIAWLQYKPFSPEQQSRDSVLREEARGYDENVFKQLDKDLVNPESVFMKLATSKDPAALEKGKRYFAISCAVCHHENAGGMIGPNLTDEHWLHGNSIKALFTSIYGGVTDRGMPSWKAQFDTNTIALIIAYIHSLQGSNPPNAKAPQGKKEN